MAADHFCYTITADDVTALGNSEEVVCSEEDFSVYTQKAVCSFMAMKSDGENIPIENGLKAYINGSNDLVIIKGTGTQPLAAGDVVHFVICLRGFSSPMM
jgi:hypothetical protein